MNSSALGSNTSEVEVTHISSHGVWLLAHGKEHFMSYDDFPWFKSQTVELDNCRIRVQNFRQKFW